MDKELYVLLQIHLDELSKIYRTTFDLIDKKKIREKINAVELLLNLEDDENKRKKEHRQITSIRKTD